MNGSGVGLSPTPRAGGTDARLGLMLTELRLPTIKRLVAPLCAQSDREGWPGHRLLEALLGHEMTERQTRRLPADLEPLWLQMGIPNLPAAELDAR